MGARCCICAIHELCLLSRQSIPQTSVPYQNGDTTCASRCSLSFDGRHPTLPGCRSRCEPRVSIVTLRLRRTSAPIHSSWLACPFASGADMPPLGRGMLNFYKMVPKYCWRAIARARLDRIADLNSLIQARPYASSWCFLDGLYQRLLLITATPVPAPASHHHVGLRGARVWISFDT